MTRLGTLDAVREALRQPPFQRFLVIDPLAVDAVAGRVVFALPWRPEYARAPDGNRVHGGVISAFIDIAADYALSVRLGDFVPTINLRVDYLRPAAGTLKAEARVIKAGRTIGVVDVEVTDETERTVAIGRGTFAIEPG